MYDFLIVGSGLFGAVVANVAASSGKSVLVIERRPHIAGNIYTELEHNIHVHKYGAHIFHTNNRRAWEFVNKFSTFNRYTHGLLANYKGEIYSLPFNMYMFNKLWGVITPEEARIKIEEQKLNSGITNPKNLEEQAISLVGYDIYNKVIKGYTEKQWGRKCSELPPSIIKRLPVRFNYDNNYYYALYQGIPEDGYTNMIAKMLDGVEVKTNCDFLENRHEIENVAEKIIYTGAIDEYFNFEFGTLEYRTVRFESEYLPDVDNFQGNSVINYTDTETPYTRIIEHKHFCPEHEAKGTVITREYSSEWHKGDEPYYPVNDEKNNALYQKYKMLAAEKNNLIFGGRLGEYKYYDMDQVVASALDLADKIII